MMRLVSQIAIALLVTCMLLPARAQTLIQGTLWTQPPEYVLDRAFAQEHYGVELFCKPYGGAIWHIYQPFVGTRNMFAVFADPGWNRLVYLSSNYSVIRTHGGPGTGTNQYRIPQAVVVIAPNDSSFVPNYYNVFVLDNGNNRIQYLRFYWTDPGNGLIHQRYYANPLLPNPVDFDHDNGGDHSFEGNDRIWVVNANNKVTGFRVFDGNVIANYGFTGSGTGQFDSLTAIACGHDPGNGINNDNSFFVADAGNSRIVKLRYPGNSNLQWVTEVWNYFVPVITDMEVDPGGHLWAMTSEGLLIKFSSDLQQVLAELPMGGTASHQLYRVTSLSNAGGRYGTGGLMFDEEWTDSTGIKGFSIGTDIKDLNLDDYLDGVYKAKIRFLLTDISSIRVNILRPNLSLVKTVYDDVSTTSYLPAGKQSFNWDGRDAQGNLVPSGQYIAEVYAHSWYLNLTTLEYSAEVLDTIHFTHGPQITCTWKVGDADGNGIYTISDAVYLITFIFGGGPAPTPHPVGSGDADCNGVVNISDNVYLVTFIFGGGPPPACLCSAYR